MPKNPLVLMLMCAVVVIWQIYELAGAVEAPSRAVEGLHYLFLVLALIGLVGGGIQYAASRSGAGER